MKRRGAALALVLAAACSHPEERPAPARKDAAAAPALPSGIDIASFDTSVRPQDDLFRAVNGAWVKKVEIPADHSSYGAFIMLADKT